MRKNGNQQKDQHQIKFIYRIAMRTLGGLKDNERHTKRSLAQLGQKHKQTNEQMVNSTGAFVQWMEVSGRERTEKPIRD